MPVPQPNKGETREEFVARFMSNDTMKKEYPDNKQRLAIAFSTWRRSKQQMNLKFNYQVPIIESAFVNDDFIITGVALNATITSNNHKFLGEELKKSAGTLSGVPLLIDHRNEVDAIKGRVISGEFDENGQKVDFRAHVIDNTMKEMIKDGRINSVSVGAAVAELEETDDGFFIPRGIEFKELSLVAVPADAGATFQIALQEAYETAVGEVTESYSNAEEVKKAMVKFNKITFKSNEEKMLERLKIINAGRKFKMDTTEFEKATSTQTVAKDDNIQQLNKSGGKIMESKDETGLEKEEVKPEEEVKSEGKTEDNVENEAKVADEKIKALELKLKNQKIKALEKQVKEQEELEAEVKTEESEDEDEVEDEVVEEKYKIVQGYGTLKGGSFTLVRT